MRWSRGRRVVRISAASLIVGALLVVTRPGAAQGPVERQKMEPTFERMLSLQGEPADTRRGVFEARDRGIMRAPRIFRGIGVAPDGAAFVAGSFRGACRLGDATLISHGRNDAMLGLFDETGRLQWFKRFGGKGGDYLFDIVTDKQGDAVVTGMVGPGFRIDGRPLRSFGGGDTFTGKVDRAGRWVWVRTVGGRSHDGGNEVCVDLNNRVMVVGNALGEVSTPDRLLEHRGGMDAFVLCYSASGKLSWARQLAGSGDEQGRGIASDTTGHVLVAGEFTVDIEAGDERRVESRGGRDVFVARYRSEGGLEWLRSFGEAGEDYARGVGADARDHVYVSGVFHGRLAMEDHIIDAQGAGIFLAKLTPEGRAVWLRKIVDARWAEGCEIEVTPTGEVTVIGAVANAVSRDSVIATGSGLGLFIARFDYAGRLLWSRIVGASDRVAGYALGLDGAGGVAAVGSFRGRLIADGHLLDSAGNDDAFIVWLPAAFGGSFGRVSNDQ